MQEAQPPSPSFPIQSPLSSKQSKRGCNCKNSRCLKLYCECFSLGEYCSNCNCVNCHNNSSSEVKTIQNFRKEAIQGILERNPQAFRPKISPFSPQNYSKDLTRHSKGCACKRTGCLKKYCECYQAGISCSDMCKCIECKNDFKCDDRYSELPVKRIIFRSECNLGNLDVVKGFVDNVLKDSMVKIKKLDEDECNLMCEEETLASEGNSNPCLDSPRKKIYTFSSDYKRFENLLYENLITSLQKSCE